ncbi:MAG: Hsp70 family protein [Acidobacteria bacterium]|nr:Hsp70 family protein [Acidobacteriota bacterium]
MNDWIVGIDLGTTNSEVAAFAEGQVRVLGPGDNRILPSVVGFSASGELLVGEAARNQQALYPERTIRSIKRKMGSTDAVEVGGRYFQPQEVSALILRELAEWARAATGVRPGKAVITVPAYFSDAQRSATREAGALAGLEVVRILNEPTAASLAYGFGDGAKHTALVYDLGGGTFDVSVVTVEGEVTEVLASHGNNHLGGDDFDDLLASWLAGKFEKLHGFDPRKDNPRAAARLWWAAEEAKKKLSSEPYVQVREEALLVDNGKPLNLRVEISRDEYEEMIRPLVHSTLDSVSKALQDANLRPQDMDAILLVGGSTRTPLVSNLLRERTGLEPRQDVHPDLCVALGAGVLASRLSGQAVERVLVDVSPYSFGVSYLGERGGYPYSHCYKPIIPRNTPLPLTRSERFYTSHPDQEIVEVEVFQGEDEDSLRNILVGDFRVEGLTLTGNEPNEILCRMRLDLDGILEVTAVEKVSGKSKRITIANAMHTKTPEEIEAGRRRLQALFQDREGAYEEGAFEEIAEVRDPAIIEVQPDPETTIPAGPYADVEPLLERSRAAIANMHPDDREEAIDLHEKIANARDSRNEKDLLDSMKALKELLFFVEGNR